MNFDEIMGEINGKSLDGIIKGLIVLSDFLKRDSIQAHCYSFIFHSLLPKMEHNHYKIRSISLLILEMMLQNAFHSIDQPNECLPKILSGLFSTKSEIQNTCLSCLSIFIENANLNEWMESITVFLESTNVIKVKLSVIRLIVSKDRGLAIDFLIKLLIYSDNVLRKRIAELLSIHKPDMIKSALTSNSVPYSIYREISLSIDNYHSCSNSFNEEKSNSDNIDFICSIEHEPDIIIGDRSRIEKPELVIDHSELSIAIPEKDPKLNEMFTEPLTEEPYENQQNFNVSSPTPVPIISQEKAKKVRSSIAFRDLSKATWIERLAFLENIKCELENGNAVVFGPKELMNTIVSSINPFHIKLIPIISQVIILSVGFFPELIPEFIDSIIDFIINSLSNHFDSGIIELLDTIMNESNPIVIIDSLVKSGESQSKNEKRKLLIMRVLGYYDKISFPKTTFYCLLSFLLSISTKDESYDSLMRFLYDSSPGNFISFYNHQIETNKKYLRKFIRKSQTVRAPTKKIDVGLELKSNLSQRDLILIIEKEIQSKNECNFENLVFGFLHLRIDDIDHVLRLFRLFLSFLSVVDNQTLLLNNQYIYKLSQTVFSSPQLLSFIDDDSISQNTIKGLANFLNYSNRAVLKGSNIYYSSLYKLFCRSNSKGRKYLAKIIFEIQNHTGIVFSNQESVNKYHQAVINGFFSIYNNRE